MPRADLIKRKRASRGPTTSLSASMTPGKFDEKSVETIANTPPKGPVRAFDEDTLERKLVYVLEMLDETETTGTSESPQNTAIAIAMPMPQDPKDLKQSRKMNKLTKASTKTPNPQAMKSPTTMITKKQSFLCEERSAQKTKLVARAKMKKKMQMSASMIGGLSRTNLRYDSRVASTTRLATIRSIDRASKTKRSTNKRRNKKNRSECTGETTSCITERAQQKDNMRRVHLMGALVIEMKEMRMVRFAGLRVSWTRPTTRDLDTYVTRGILPFGISRYKGPGFTSMSRVAACLGAHTARPPG